MTRAHAEEIAKSFADADVSNHDDVPKWAVDAIEHALSLMPDDVLDRARGAPIPMILTCPICRERHIDEDEFATKPHATHACQFCGMVWRPALVDTVGVQFLPGYKSERERSVDIFEPRLKDKK